MSVETIVRMFGWAVMLAALVTGRASAEVGDLVNRLPPGANSIAFINVESLLSSKLGQAEDWRGRLSDAYATKPMIVPPGTKQVVMASWFELPVLEPVWEVSVIQASKAVSMKRIARDENGFTEKLVEKRAVWTPLNAYFVLLDAHLLGVVCPADRQFTARWAYTSSAGADPLSPYLRGAIEEIGPKTGYLFALDLQDAVSEKRVQRRLAMGEIDSVADLDIDVRKVSKAVAGVKGLRLLIEVDAEITGDCVIEFSRPVSALSSFAKPLLMEVLGNAGAAIEGFDSWKIKTKDTSILARRNLSTEGLRQLCSIIDPPTPTLMEDDEPDQPEGDSNDEPDRPVQRSAKAGAAASKKYYQAVAKMIDGFGKRVRGASSLREGATYVARDARRIDRLPILSVDPELVQWGTGVSSRLLEVASALGVSGHQARARTESILDPEKRGGSSSELEIRTDRNEYVDRKNAARQRRAAAAEERAKVLEQATGVLKEIELSRAEIRAVMTQRYETEF